MISNRAPELGERVDAILDSYLDGKRSKRKRNYHLNRVLEALPPKVCGCHFCRFTESSDLSELVCVDETEEEDDGA